VLLVSGIPRFGYKEEEFKLDFRWSATRVNLIVNRLSKQMTIANLAHDLYAKQPLETLYHYTSLSGVVGIVESGALRATDIRFFSDAAEMKRTAELLRTAIAQRLERDSAKSRLLVQLSDWLSHRLTDGHMLYVACFTANGNLLSQWRSYCPTAKGVSIGFRPEKITAAATNQSFQVGMCVYDAKTRRQLSETILDMIEEVAQHRGENMDPSKRHPSNSFHDVFEEIEADLLRVAALLKHPSFHEEQEWRIVSTVMTNYIEAPIEYREGPSMLVPFVKFFLPEAADRSLDIEHVFLGPTPNVNNSMSSLSRYLSKKGASPRQGIQYCQIPYRAW
jgi:hypothetical protein